MRILVVSSLYPPQALGGYERSCADVMTRLHDRGHEVSVLTTDTRLPGVDDEVQPHVHRTLRWYWDNHQIVQPSAAQRWAIERHNRATLRHTIEQCRPDVVSVWSMGAMSLGLIDVLNAAGVPVAYVVCDEWPVYGPRLDAWLALYRRRRTRPVAPVVRRLSGLSTALPAPRDATFLWLSAFVRDRVLAATGWRPAHETVTYSGIDTDDFPIATDTEANDWSWRLLCVGRVEPRKGFMAAVEALAALPTEATLRVIGPDDGTHAAELMTLADRLGIADRVHIGALPRHELRRAYAAADAFLFTSAWQEPFGLTPVEAMACGTPVVAAATGGSAEYLADEVNCLVVPPRDSAALASATRRLAECPALRDRLVAAGRATAAELTVDALTDVMERWHAAAALGYPDGEPAARPPLSKPEPA